MRGLINKSHLLGTLHKHNNENNDLQNREIIYSEAIQIVLFGYSKLNEMLKKPAVQAFIKIIR